MSDVAVQVPRPAPAGEAKSFVEAKSATRTVARSAGRRAFATKLRAAARAGWCADNRARCREGHETAFASLMRIRARAAKTDCPSLTRLYRVIRFTAGALLNTRAAKAQMADAVSAKTASVTLIALAVSTTTQHSDQQPNARLLFLVVHCAQAGAAYQSHVHALLSSTGSGATNDISHFNIV